MLKDMQDWPLLVSKILEHAELNHSYQEIFSKLPEGGEFRYSMADMAKRARQAAQAFQTLGVKEGDRVGTLAWNTHRHVEIWYAASGMGAVTHTINPRLFPEQLVYIMNHAEDKILCVDVTFVPLVQAIEAELKTVEKFIVMVGKDHMPEGLGDNWISYEEILMAESGEYAWPDLDENTPCGLCYTSGTTGNPKGVQYTHRSNFLHTLIAISGDTLGITAKSVILPVVPMFHANAWGIPYAACATGCKMVLNGPHFEPDVLHDIIIREDVNVTAAVPTVWTGMLQYLKDTGKDMGKLTTVTIGGSAAPRSMIEEFQENYGVRVNHAWGMTEMSPLGSIGSENAAVANLSKKEKLDVQCKQGRTVLGVEMKIVDDEGNSLPRDGKTSGNLLVRGPWVVDTYYRADTRAVDNDGWFDTGDVACIDEYGYMQITDRSKDVIKSGGEWVSSIDLENAAVAHPDVVEAAVIGRYHPKWEERPLLILKMHEGKTVTLEEMHEFLLQHVIKWWLPDGIEFVDELPHTATGKISKKDLRDQFKDYKFPGT
ncbi:long-chain-fatty-acid--CoA ligase [Kordiimonas sediminis]|uniref:3-methylmercaptopropionyl-CoA ligase n=1 Tax=Kordiimonas sediminis TaxID=1735581 RepID=A0A919E845_9PROT|nr:long-chain fatty acid--CoA ligase [Kordiimonas sediminis]GHF23492.1 long-chain-fatty-acid--CoA ligase [Kordiimonas sediminis]